MTDYSTDASAVKTALDAVYAKKTDKNVFYGTCSTGASTQTKTVTANGWSFTTGNILFVKFTNGNTYNGTAQIKIDSTTKDIATVGTTKTSRYHWVSGEVIGFVYDGTNMVMIDDGLATTTYYGVTKLSSSTSSTSETLAATPKAVKTAYDLANGKLSSTDVGAAAISNSYADLDNKPTIPSNVSDLNNDSGYITSSSLPTKTSDLTNDGDGTNAFLTQHQSLSNYIEKSNTAGLIKNDGSIDTSSYITSSAITGMLTSSDIVDNLTTNDATKVLSAKQGKALADLIGNAITYINQ